MVKKSVINYVRGLIQKGYDVSTIKSNMLKYGYTSNEIDEAIRYVYNPTVRHEIHLSKATIFVVIFVVISLLGAAGFYFFSQPKAPSKLLDVNLEPVSTSVQAGNEIVFLKEISNLGSSQRYDVELRQELLEPKSGKVVTQKAETRAVETTGSSQTQLLVPKDTKPGDYILRVIAEYDGKRAVATLPVKIIASSQQGQKETCFDGIKNQNEQGIDCGGTCSQCAQQQPKGCDDNDFCTTDSMENGKCVNKAIVPCCGNFICEEQEICKMDCEQIDQNFELISTETLNEIKETAKTNPSVALQQCSKMQVPDLKDTCISNIAEIQKNTNYCNQIKSQRIKDLCFSNIAEQTKNNALCSEIKTDTRRDSCYAFFFVPANMDFTVCSKLINEQVRQSCEQLKQLYDLDKEFKNLPQQNVVQENTQEESQPNEKIDYVENTQNN